MSLSPHEGDEQSFEALSYSFEGEQVVDASSPSNILKKQNHQQKITIKQLQNTIVNIQEDCATYPSLSSLISLFHLIWGRFEQKYMQGRQEGEKLYQALFSKTAKIKELAKKVDSLEKGASVKVHTLIISI